MHPATARALLAIPKRARSNRPPQPTAAAAANVAASRLQPPFCPSVRIVSARAPLVAHQRRSRQPKLNKTPKPLAATAPKKAWCSKCSTSTVRLHSQEHLGKQYPNRDERQQHDDADTSCSAQSRVSLHDVGLGVERRHSGHQH